MKSQSRQKYYENFEIWHNELKLKLKVYLQILLLLILAQIITLEALISAAASRLSKSGKK